MSRHLRHLVALVAALLAAASIACSSAEEPSAPVASTPVPAPSPVATTEPVPTTAAPAPSADYNSNRNMNLLFAGLDYNPGASHEAIERAVANKDKSMVPVLIEMLRFFRTWDLVTEAKTALTIITGEDINAYSRGWFEWMEWLGNNAEEYAPPDGYVEWKSELMSLIDPRFGEFLAPAANGSRINVAEIAWGGVRPDGIPDLQDAPVVTADKQDYLLPSDRVFGVSINGDHRAYPLRIVNAHEMANDVLGGEPIALAY